MGRLLQKILKEDKFTHSTLANYNFLDIGGGLGKAVIHFRSYHKSKCVSIESSSNAYNGSLMLFHELVKEENGKRIPFIPILGDAYDLKDFGGAFIVYAWIQGATCDIFELLFDLFVEDKTCMYYVTSEKYSCTLLEENDIAIKGSIHGKFESSSSSMVLYIYFKRKILTNKREVSSQWKGKSDVSSDIYNAFDAYSFFHNMKRNEKNKDSIYTLTNIEDPTMKKGKVLMHSRKLRSKKTTKCSILKKSDIIDLTVEDNIEKVKIVKKLIFIDEDSQDSDSISLNEDCITDESKCESILDSKNYVDIGKKWENIRRTLFSNDDSDDSEGEETGVDEDSDDKEREESDITDKDGDDNIIVSTTKIFIIDEGSDVSEGEVDDEDDSNNIGKECEKFMQSPIIIDEGSDVSEGEVDDEDDSESIIVINNKNHENSMFLDEDSDDSEDTIEE